VETKREESNVSLKHVAAVGAATLLLIGGNVAMAGTASADPLQQVSQDGWCDLGEVCLFYHSNLVGAVFDSTYTLWNYGAYQFKCSRQAFGDGPLCSGSGEPVWNNAASVYNRNKFCDVAIFYHSNYGGAVQVIPRQHWANLNPTLKNNNASQKFVNC
jgi:hypothetical protein